MPRTVAKRTNLTERFLKSVKSFDAFGRESVELETLGVPTFVNEFWTSRQRQSHSLHEVSYRACFKAQLPRFFIERLTAPDERVYDPFTGRGTTPLEAALLGRTPVANDLSPLSERLLRPRLRPPRVRAVEARLERIDLSQDADTGPVPREDLEAFFHPDTLREIAALRSYCLERETNAQLHPLDRWIRMVALNRLTGHSKGFFSVYTLPPNQAVTAKAQRAINTRRDQTPEARPIKERILRKTRSLLRDLDETERRGMWRRAPRARLSTRPADSVPQLATGSVSLVVTSPPFLDVVDYATDNWLRCWFSGIDVEGVELTVPRSLDSWQESMTKVFHELHRVVRPGGHVAFEVGEVRGGSVRLEESVIPCAREAGFEPLLVMINDQEFTKTANCWGVSNQTKGTNTNRIVVLVRP